MKQIVLMVSLVLCLVLAGPAGAEPNYFADTDHYYEFVWQTGLTWSQARIAAEARSFLGHQGYLATITTQTEYEFIQTTFSSYSFIESWLGGWQNEGSNPEENWNWVTAEIWDYTRWAPGEPNDQNGDQRFLMMWGDQVTNPDRLWRWGDDHEDTHPTSNHGYFVEYPIPEPATLSLLLIGGLAILRRRRR